MSPSARAATRSKPPKDWQREAAGTYRSADGRFTLEGDGSGRWFVRDEQETDELGLPRTTGPYATLAGAKDAAAGHREHGPEPSPLAVKLAAAAGRPESGRDAAGRRGAGRPAPPSDRTVAGPAKAAADGGKPWGAARAGPAPADQERRVPAAAPPTWLETLEARDRDAARRARELVRDLEALGIDDAEGVVRRDVVGNQPEVAKRLLAEAIRRAMTRELEPRDLVARARGAGVRPADDEAFAAYVVARSLAAAIGVLSASDRLADGSPRLPGWELVERAPAHRRLRLTADDLT